MEKIGSKSHAQVRSVERYGQELSMPLIAKIVRDGAAKCVAPAKDGCAFYDVPYKRYAGGRGPEMVRALLSADNTRVLTVVPPQTPGANARARIKQRRDGWAEQRREFFKRFEDDEDVTVSR